VKALSSSPSTAKKNHFLKYTMYLMLANYDINYTLLHSSLYISLPCGWLIGTSNSTYINFSSSSLTPNFAFSSVASFCVESKLFEPESFGHSWSFILHKYLTLTIQSFFDLYFFHLLWNNN
jgi:hypothetical protein